MSLMDSRYPPREQRNTANEDEPVVRSDNVIHSAVNTMTAWKMRMIRPAKNISFNLSPVCFFPKDLNSKKNAKERAI